MNTPELKITWGSYKNQKIGEIPAHYLRWGVQCRAPYPVWLPCGTPKPFHVVARIELERRGLRIEGVDIPLRAIDSLTMNAVALRHYFDTGYRDDVGLAEWTRDRALKVIRMIRTNPEKFTPDKRGHVELTGGFGFTWVIDMEKDIPVLIGVK